MHFLESWTFQVIFKWGQIKRPPLYRGFEQAEDLIMAALLIQNFDRSGNRQFFHFERHLSLSALYALADQLQHEAMAANPNLKPVIRQPAMEKAITTLIDYQILFKSEFSLIYFSPKYTKFVPYYIQFSIYEGQLKHLKI